MITPIKDIPDEDWSYYANDLDRFSYKGGIGIYYPGCYGDSPEPPFFDLAIELKDIGPVLRFLKKSFPKGWRIENGEVIGL